MGRTFVSWKTAVCFLLGSFVFSQKILAWIEIFLNATAVAQDQEGSGLGRRGLGVRSLVAPEPGVAPSAFIRVWMFYLEERKSE